VSELLFETDWIGSRPVYYNESTGAASHDINEVIAFADVELDPEGLNAYLGMGFSVFQRTPVRGVRIMPASARLWRDDDGTLRVEDVPLDLERRLAQRHSEDDVIDLLRARVQAAESTAEGEIVIPTSGGYDSRLLNLMIADRSRVRSYTFGPTARQWDSTQVTRARAFAGVLGTSWQQVRIAPFHFYLDAWDEAFGPAVHAHGMYQMDFYRRVRSLSQPGALVLSGLCGDGFAGSVDDLLVGPIRGPQDVQLLIFTNGQHVDLSAAAVPSQGALAEEYFERHRELLDSPRWRLVEEVRFRVLLTHYLLKVPELYGMRTDAPFIDIDVATAMMTLPDERRRRRRWVADYLAGRGALLDNVTGNDRYWLYWPVMRSQPLAALDERLLAEVVRPDYVRWINRAVSWRGLWYEGYERLGRRRGFRRAAACLRSHGLRQRRLEAYHAYMTLRPLQRLLQKRDAARAAGTADTAHIGHGGAAARLRRGA